MAVSCQFVVILVADVLVAVRCCFVANQNSLMHSFMLAICFLFVITHILQWQSRHLLLVQRRTASQSLIRVSQSLIRGSVCVFSGSHHKVFMGQVNPLPTQIFVGHGDQRLGKPNLAHLHPDI
jgi:amino acid permease